MSTDESSGAGVIEALSRGDALGRYLVLERIGTGAMGVVYAAYDPELDRKVAIKLLRRLADDAGESRRQGRFVREAKSIAKLAHPNVVSIFDVGVDGGRVFLAMEYLAGGTLGAWMAAEKRPWRAVVKMFVDVGRGLAAAHAEGLVHRDFKPDNVLLDRAGTPKVADFGLARLSGAPGIEDSSSSDTSDGREGPALEPPKDVSRVPTPLTRSGALAGTPAYMAPEQFLGKRTDGRTDQFAFCVALHEALYGKRPFDEDTIFELADSVIRERLQPAPKNASVPGWLRRSVVRGLRADPNQRYAKIEDLLVALEADPVARLRKIVVACVVGVTLVATLGGLYRRSERRRLEFEGRVAAKVTDGRQALSDAAVIDDRLVTARGRAFAAFDAGRREDGETAWTEARAAASKLEATLKHAQAALEAALTLDAANEHAREALGEALFERAQLAELEHRKADLAHAVEQMERFDQRGLITARWTSPGSVEVRTSPDGARIVLERYDGSGDEVGTRLVALGVGEPFVSASGERALPPGSYRLRATKAGFAETRLPFVVHRGEHLRLALTLVAATDVPADFVYVPEGRFLYGEADEDWRLGFLNAVPIHERATPAFLIKAHETTFGEWFEFLRDLPPAERRQRTPSSRAVQGSVVVEGSNESDWSFEFNISGYRVTAPYKSPVVYPARRTHAAQDWLKMPVVAISPRDMDAYLAWLSRTGRVPGARFCNEVEWERAARGADGRTSPGSEVRVTGDDANIDVTYGRTRGSYGPDEVGTHPGSESPFGLEDMAGNAWEVVEARDDAAGSLIRGGSYYQDAITARSTNREPIDLETRSNLVGLRVCAAPK